VSSLARYLVRTVLGYTALVLLVLIALGSLFLFIGQQDDIGTGGYTIREAAIFVALNLPTYIAQLLPVAALIGTLLGLGHLANGSELVVMRASPAFAQVPAPSPPAAAPVEQEDKLEPDRPDVTNSTHIVDDGLLQIELGWIFNRPDDAHPNRKPGIGMVLHYLRDRAIDLDGSAMVGDRATDMEFAQALGVRGFRFGEEWDWPGIAHALAAAPRMAQVQRATRETRVEVQLDLDRPLPCLVDVEGGRRGEEAVLADGDLE